MRGISAAMTIFASMNGKTKGYILGAFAAASYGLNPTFALPLYSAGLNTLSVLLLRYSLALPMIALMIFLRGRSFKVSLDCLPGIVWLGILMSTSSLTLFVSYNYMPAGIASSILFVYPILVALIMTVFHKEKLTMQTMLCLLLALSGIVMLYNVGDGETLSLAGTFIVLISALSYAVYMVDINKPRMAGVATLTILFYLLITGILIFSAIMIVGSAMGFGGGAPVIASDIDSVGASGVASGVDSVGASGVASGADSVGASGVASGADSVGASCVARLRLTLPGTWYLWLDAVALALFPTVVSLVCTTRSIQIIGPTPTAILGALEPVTAVVMGVIFFDEGMTAREAFGITMIVVAVSFVIAGGAISGSAIIRHLTRFRQMFPKLRR